MSNTKKILNHITKKVTPFLGRKATILLTVIILTASLVSDHYLANSQLGLALISSTLISSIVTASAIPQLRDLKINQIIRKEGPKNHYKKTGTPTMGGLLIVPIGLIVGNLIINEINEKIIALSFLIFCFMLIGIYDDWKSLTFKRNTGLTPKGKITLQIIISLIFLGWASFHEWISSEIYLFSTNSIDIGVLIWPLALFVLLAESNATNLTDGLDGLASGCGALVFTGLGIQLMLRSNGNDPILAIFCMAMAGIWLGFLQHNQNPAKIFMGDTGSLSMGAALCGISLLSNSLWALFIMGGVFFAESISVIIQVWFFKITKIMYGEGKRFFKMAPIHHHYELKGNNEQEIVENFWLITLFLVLIGLLLKSNP